MSALLFALIAVLVTSALMSMTGRGGGNFYVPILVACGLPMLSAASTGQCILVASALAASHVFQQKHTIDWKLTLLIGFPTNLMALVGGYCAHRLGGRALEVILTILLVVASFLMLRPAKERVVVTTNRPRLWRRQFGGHEYAVNVWLMIPITAAIGLVGGMTGISGGSFLVPLMVLVCGVPMRTALGTATALVATTALIGLIGHIAGGHFRLVWAMPMSMAAIVGGLAGSRLAFKARSEYLKKLFAYTTLAAAVFMGLMAWRSQG
jgi:uncharacterized membrane protein YfcA